MNYQDLEAALQIFGIGERATLQQIKRRYRELVKLHHPDQATGETPETIRRINAAYRILTDYCSSYRYCFSEEEFLEQVPAERIKRQFGWDPVWGGVPEETDD